MAAPDGFDPRASLLPDPGPSVPIHVMRGGAVAAAEEGEMKEKKPLPVIFNDTDLQTLAKYGLAKGGIIEKKLDDTIKSEFLKQLKTCKKNTGESIILKKDCWAVSRVIRELIHTGISSTNTVHIAKGKLPSLAEGENVSEEERMLANLEEEGEEEQSLEQKEARLKKETEQVLTLSLEDPKASKPLMRLLKNISEHEVKLTPEDKSEPSTAAPAPAAVTPAPAEATPAPAASVEAATTPAPAPAASITESSTSTETVSEPTPSDEAAATPEDTSLPAKRSFAKRMSNAFTRKRARSSAKVTPVDASGSPVVNTTPSKNSFLKKFSKTFTRKKTPWANSDFNTALNGVDKILTEHENIETYADFLKFINEQKEYTPTQKNIMMEYSKKVFKLRNNKRKANEASVNPGLFSTFTRKSGKSSEKGTPMNSTPSNSTPINSVVNTPIKNNEFNAALKAFNTIIDTNPTIKTHDDVVKLINERTDLTPAQKKVMIETSKMTFNTLKSKTSTTPIEEPATSEEAELEDMNLEPISREINEGPVFISNEINEGAGTGLQSRNAIKQARKASRAANQEARRQSRAANRETRRQTRNARRQAKQQAKTRRRANRR